MQQRINFNRVDLMTEKNTESKEEDKLIKLLHNIDYDTLEKMKMKLKKQQTFDSNIEGHNLTMIIASEQTSNFKEDEH